MLDHLHGQFHSGNRYHVENRKGKEVVDRNANFCVVDNLGKTREVRVVKS